jgi:hypothetical protein
MMPSFERPFLLHVGEIVVPFELGDAGDPLCAQGQKRKQAERSHNDRANAGGVWICRRILRRRRRDTMKFVDSGLAGGGHDARQVFRVGKERKDARQREGNPVFELELVVNSSQMFTPAKTAGLCPADSREPAISLSKGGCPHMSFL